MIEPTAQSHTISKLPDSPDTKLPTSYCQLFILDLFCHSTQQCELGPNYYVIKFRNSKTLLPGCTNESCVKALVGRIWLLRLNTAEMQPPLKSIIRLQAGLILHLKRGSYSIVFRSTDLEARLPGLKSQHCHLADMNQLLKRFMLNFLIYEMG